MDSPRFLVFQNDQHSLVGIVERISEQDYVLPVKDLNPQTNSRIVSMWSFQDQEIPVWAIERTKRICMLLNTGDALASVADEQREFIKKNHPKTFLISEQSKIVCPECGRGIPACNCER